MDILDRLRSRARAQPSTLVFPEGTDSRIVQAAAVLAREGNARPILLGDADAIRATAERTQVELPPMAQLIDPTTSGLSDRVADLLMTKPGPDGWDDDADANQGGISRVSTLRAIVRAHGRVSSNVMNDIGATRPLIFKPADR